MQDERSLEDETEIHRGKKLFDHKEEAEPVARALREPYPQEFLDGL
jgi:hypothetical protein